MMPTLPNMRTRALASAAMAILAATASGSALASSVGSVAPYSNNQPTIALTELTPLYGVYPTHDTGTATGDTLGFIYNFAGNYTTADTATASGQTVSIATNTAEYSVVGTTYGGNGTSNFALPNLGGKATIGAGSTTGLGPQYLGQQSGYATVTPTGSNLPAGGGQPLNNMQPTLALTPLIATSAVFPVQGGGASSTPQAFLGEIAYTAGTYTPGGWMVANGQVLNISQNQALFAIIGTTYGGNGTTTFALPNLVDRVAVGATGANPIGTAFGSEGTTITAANLTGKPINNDQPSLAVNYLISVTGIYPSREGGGFDSEDPTLGQVVAFASNYTPAGYLEANGQLLSIMQYQALFSILGTTYGGDGKTTFALPDLDGRTIIGTDATHALGSLDGSDTVTLAYTPPVVVTPPAAVPEPTTWAMMIGGFGLIGGVLRRHGRRIALAS